MPALLPELETSVAPAVPAVADSPRAASGISVDEFQALEQKVLRAVEIVRREREARATAEAAVAATQAELSAARERASEAERQAAEANEQIALLTEQLDAAQTATTTQVHTLNQERDAIRVRVEKMLEQMDALL